MIGDAIGPYRIVGKIGSGGMGVVYLAQDTRLERPVALKFVRTTDDPGAARQLLREARAASALNHPGICTVYEVGESGSNAYIAMEYVEGPTLADRLVAAPFSADDVLAIGVQIAAALAHAHGRGVVHRDLKSANIVLGPENRVKLLDFGLSRRLAVAAEDMTRPPETLSEAGLISGTPAYLSPEVLRGATADERADLWALGVTLYEMCASRRPFLGATLFEVSAAILSSEPRPLPSHVPAPLDNLVMRSLSKDPAARFPTAAAFREALEGAARGDGTGPRRPGLRTLAVLPFENLSGDEAQDFFADGMTDAITAAVARLGSFRVISRTSTMQFKRDRPPLPDIARRLNADAVVEGSVMRAGERVRVAAQLVDARADEHLWAETHDRRLTDVLDLQDDIARAIVNGIQARLATPTPDSRGASAPDERARRAIHPDAYVEYLRGRHAWTRRTTPALRQAIASYERAIELDPTYARAYAGIAECHGVLGFFGATAPRNAFPPAKAAARRALHLDPREGSAHVALGYVATHHRWEFDAATTAFQEGLRLAPDDMNGRHWYALLLTSKGERDAAVEQMRLAQEMDPLSAIARTAMGLVLHFFGEFEAAAAECRDALDLSPGYAPAEWTLAKAMLGRGDAAGALEILERLVHESRWSPGLGDFGRALGLCGLEERARAVLDELSSAATRGYVRPYDIALVHMGLHEHDAALARLQQAFDEGGNWLNYLRLDPAFEALRGEQRFVALVRRVANAEGGTAPASP